MMRRLFLYGYRKGRSFEAGDYAELLGVAIVVDGEWICTELR